MKSLIPTIFFMMCWVQGVDAFASTATAGHPIMPMSEVQTGMKGHGLSVFSGTVPKPFQFEVIGKLENRLPKQSLIIVRMSGQNLEHSGTVAGMSGSPLYIDDRLIGAVSYAWGFAKDPIAGVTPIESMLDDLARDPRSIGQFVSREGAKAIWGPYQVDHDLAAALGRLGMKGARSDETAMTPIALPLSLPAMEPALEEIIRRGFAGSAILPVTAGASNATPSTEGLPAIVPGGVLGIAFLTGDVSMSGVGTITDVVGDRLIGFGHPMMQVGATDIPMLASNVVTVLANQKLSFKMASSGPIFGQMTGDFQSSVVGDMTRRSKMIPIAIHVHSEELGVDEQYNMEAVPMPSFFPLVVISGFSSAMHHALPHALAFQYKVTVSWDLEDVGPGGFSTYVLSINPKDAVRNVVVQPLLHVITNPYKQVGFTRFDVDVEVLPRRNLARIVRVSLPVKEARVGEKLEVRVHLKPFGGVKEFVRVIPFTPTADQVGRTLTLDVGSAVRLMRKELPRHIDLASYMKHVIPVGQYNELALRVSGEGLTVDSGGVLYPEAPIALRAKMPSSNEQPRAIRRKAQVVQRIEQEWLLDGNASIELTVLPAAD
jgi:hypothetical protein